MPEAVKKTIATVIPRRRSQEEILYSDGSREVRCYSPANPHYYKDGEGAFHAIDMAVVEEKGSGVGQAKLRSQNVVSAGVRADGNLSKAVGLRPDFSQAKGDHQLEFTLVSVEVDGVDQAIAGKVSAPVASAKDAKAWDMGRYLVIQNRRFCRQAVLIDRPKESFRVEFLLHVKGLTVSPVEAAGRSGWHVRDASGEVDWMVAEPLILDGNLEDIKNADGLPVSGKYVTHSLTDNKNGTFTYIKTSVDGADFSALPDQFWVDASTVYSSMVDGCIYSGTGTSWATLRGLGTGSTVNNTATSDNSAIRASFSSPNYAIYRSFFFFDTSYITGPIALCIANLYGSYTLGSPSVYLQKGTSTSSISTSDFDAFTGFAYGSFSDYWSSSYHGIPFNATGVSEINLSGVTCICAREGCDYNDTAPTGFITAGCYFADNTGITRDPFLSITTATTYTKTASSDGLIQSSGIAETASLDALAGALGVSGGLSLDALAELSGVPMSAGMDAHVGMGFSGLDMTAIAVRRNFTHTGMDAVKEALVRPGTFMDAGIMTVLADTADMDALVKVTGISLSGMDVVAQVRVPQPVGVDACLLTENVPALLAVDALLSESWSVYHGVDAAIMQGVDHSVSMAALVIAQPWETVGADAIVITPGSEATGADAALLSAMTGMASVDAALETGREAVSGMDALPMQGVGLDVGMDVVVQGEQTGGASTDAILADIRSGVSELDAAMMIPGAATAELDTLRLFSLDTTAAVDAMLKVSPVTISGVDAAVGSSPAARAVLDASLTVPGDIEFQADACISQTVAAGAGLDAPIAEKNIASSSMTAYLRVTNPFVSFLTDGLVFSTETGQTGIDAPVAGKHTATVSMDAVMRMAMPKVPVSMTAIVVTPGDTDLSVDALMMTPGDAATGLLTDLAHTVTVSGSMDAALRLSSPRISAMVDVVVVDPRDMSVPVDACVLAPGFSELGLTSDIAHTFSSDTGMDALLTVPRNTTGMDAQVVTPGDSGVPADAMLMAPGDTHTGVLADIAEVIPQNTGMDAVMRFAHPKMTTTVDAPIAEKVTSFTELMADIADVRGIGLSMDARLRMAMPKAPVSVDAIVITPEDTGFDVDGCLSMAWYETSSVDAAVLLAAAGSVDVGGLLSKAGSASSGLDAISFWPKNISADLDGFVQKPLWLVTEFNGVVEAIIESPASLDGAVLKQGFAGLSNLSAMVTAERSHELFSDACVMAPWAQAVSFDVVAARLQVENTVSTDAIIQAGHQYEVDLTGIITAVRRSEAGVSAAVQSARSGSIPADAALSWVVNASVDPSACLSVAGSSEAVVISTIISQIRKWAGVSAIVAGVFSVHAGLDGVVRGARLPPGATAREVVEAPLRYRNTKASGRVRTIEALPRIKTVHSH
jgi:hypothetical protein